MTPWNTGASTSGKETVKAPLRVLVVDDNADARRILFEALVRSGYLVEEACDGASALERARQFRPAVILMDFHMPTLDGWEATRRLKGYASTGAIPVIALTADDTRQAMTSAIDVGCDAFLVKPVSCEALIATVEKLARPPPPPSKISGARRRRV